MDPNEKSKKKRRGKRRRNGENATDSEVAHYEPANHTEESAGSGETSDVVGASGPGEAVAAENEYSPYDDSMDGVVDSETYGYLKSVEPMLGPSGLAEMENEGVLTLLFLCKRARDLDSRGFLVQNEKYLYEMCFAKCRERKLAS
jgi:hypothetical protein